MNKKLQVDYRIVMMAIFALMVIECVAMMNGINGTFRMIITILIAGAAGIAVPKEKFIKA